MGLGTRQQHAVVEGVQKLLLSQPPTFFHELPMHKRDLPGRSTEPEKPDREPGTQTVPPRWRSDGFARLIRGFIHSATIEPRAISKSLTSPPLQSLVNGTMGKLRGLAILAIVLWSIGALGYRAGTAEKLRAELAKQYGPGVVVEKVRYQEHYALNNLRHGEAIFSIPAPKEDPRNPRGFGARQLAVPVESRGRFWPEEVRHGFPTFLQATPSTP